MTTLQIQYLLAYLGYDVKPDGLMGPQTKAATETFQADYGGITVDGNPGQETQKALRDAVAYNKFRPPDSVSEDSSETGTFWDEIKYFGKSEFKCKCGGKYCDGFPAEPQEDMVRLAEAARAHFGRPATVISGLRCARHNVNEGGVENSQHMYGEACDICIDGVNATETLNFFLSQPGVRYAYAINDTNVHFDIPKGVR